MTPQINEILEKLWEEKKIMIERQIRTNVAHDEISKTINELEIIKTMLMDEN
jgi:hypothetical protein